MKEIYQNFCRKFSLEQALAHSDLIARTENFPEDLRSMQQYFLRTIRARNPCRTSVKGRQPFSFFAAERGCSLQPQLRPLVFLVELTAQSTASPIRIRSFSSGNQYESNSVAMLPLIDTDPDENNRDNELRDDDQVDNLEWSDDQETESDDSTEGGNKLVYRETLNNWYRANFDVSLNEAFETSPAPLEGNSSSSATLWTSSFVCPITRHKVEAKTLPGMTHAVYFPSKKLANQAAAFQAVQFFCPVEDHSDPSCGSRVAQKELQKNYMKEHKIILNDTEFLISNQSRPGKKLGGTWWTADFRCPITGHIFPAMKLTRDDSLDEGNVIWYRRKNDAIEAACEKALWAASTGTPGMAQNENIMFNTISTEPLRLWYRKYHDLELTDQNFVVTHGNWEGSSGNVWTATFICPITGDRYDSGGLSSKPYVSAGGFQWYKKKKVAMTAAALRAYDVLRFHAAGSKDPRFCQEDPSVFDNEVWTGEDEDTMVAKEGTSQYELVAPSIRVADFLTMNDPVGESDGTNDGPDAEHDSDNILDDADVEFESDDNDEDADEYIVDFVPRRLFGGQDVVGAPRMLDIVAETWVRSTKEKKEAPLAYANTKPAHSIRMSQLNRNEAIQRARAWLSQQKEVTIETTEDRTLFDRVDIPSCRVIAKRLLQSLAASNRTISCGRDASGVEEVARSIIDFLWSSPELTPDADCFALYIQCLEGGYHRVSTTSEKIFDAMAKGIEYEGHAMPRPNVSVLNSMVQRKAEFGIKTSISELEAVEVNRETFLSCLAAIAHATGQGQCSFDSQYVLDCIHEIKKRRAESEDAYSQLDIDVYNAPMRWSGDPTEALQSRPYSRPIPWDEYEKIFETNHAFTDQNPRVKEARAIENWFRTIDAQAFGANIRPNIETYESVIQAWIRTGTSTGLDHAEAILDLLYSRQTEEIKLRTPTIQPFIAASAFAGDFARVDRWLEKLNKNNHAILRDNRLAAAPILARVTARHVGFARGDDCLRLLRELVTMAKMHENTYVDARAFAITIDAFFKQGTQTEGRIAAPGVVVGIQDTLEMFDEFLASCLDNSESDRASQVLHLLHFAPMIYSSSFAALHDIKSDSKSSLLRCLDWAERIVRRSGEHCVLREQYIPMTSSPYHEGFETEFNHGFPFHLESVLRQSDRKSWQDFHRFIIDAVAETYSDSNNQSNELLGVSILASKIARRNEGKETFSSLPLAKHFEEMYRGNNTNALVAQMEKEFGSLLSTKSGRQDSTLPLSNDNKSSNVIVHGNHEQRRIRKEKSKNNPKRRPRKVSAEQRRSSKSIIQHS